MSRHSSFLFCSLLLLFLAPLCRAQFSFKHIDVSDGLTSNSINTVFRDSRGYLWIGTDFGLNRYDGYRIKKFYQNPSNSYSLRDNYVQKLSEDSQGYLWIKSRTGITAFDTQHEMFICDYSALLRKRHLLISRLDLVLNGKGHSAYITGNRLAIYNFNTDRAVWVTPLKAKITDGAFDNGIYLWLVDTNRRIYQIDIRNGRVISTKLCPPGPTMIYATLFFDTHRNLWVIDNYKRLFYYQVTTGQWKLFDKEEFNKYPLMSIAQLQNKICLGTDHGGLFTIDCTTFKVDRILHQNKEDALSENSVISLHVDKDGILYAGTFKRGLNYTHPSYSLFELYKFDSSKTDNDVNCFAEDAQGNIWIGTNANGLYVRNRLTGKCTPVKYRQQGGGTIISLLSDHKGRFWIGTYLDGLYCIDHGKTRHFTPENSSVDKSIWSMAESRDGRILIGTLNKGLLIYKEKSPYFYRCISNHNICFMVNNIFQDSNSDLIVSASDGLFRIDAWQKTVVHYTFNKLEDRILERNAINYVTKDQRGYYWVCTQGGLAILDEGHHRYYFLQKKDGIGEQFTYMALVDHKNRIWVSTSMGLFCIEVLNYGNISDIKLNVTKFDSKNGLQSDIFNRNSGLASRDGVHLYFGGLNGYNIINPMGLHTVSGHKHLSFTELYVNNQLVNVDNPDSERGILHSSLNETDKVHLKYYENNIRIEFSALDMLFPDKDKYEIRLDGSDKEWVEVKENTPFVQYNNLPPGTYKLNIRVKDLSGTVDMQQRSLTFVIAPPFWKSGLAYIFYTLLIFAAVYAIYRTLVGRAKLQFQMEKEMESKKHVEKMYQMRVDFFTNLSHELRTPVSLIILPLQNILIKDPIWAAKHNIKMVLRNAKRLLFIVNQLLEFRKIEAGETSYNPLFGNIVSFVRDAANEFSDMSQNKNIHFTFTSNVDEMYMEFDPQKMEWVLFNLLSNSFKFTPNGGSICVSVTYEEGGNLPIKIRVSDTGIGISKEDIEKIFSPFYQVNSTPSMFNYGTGIGLAVVRKIVLLHHGEIQVESECQKGSVFTMSFHAAEAPSPRVMENTIVKPDEEVPNLSPKEKTILIVDDNDDFRYYLVDNMKSSYNVIEAENGEVALDKVKKFMPDIIIADVMMPVMDGLEFCKAVKGDFNTSFIPVILLTASIKEQNKIDGYQLGADAYLTKPFNITSLDVLIQNLLKKAEISNVKPNATHQTEKKIEISSKDEELLQKVNEVTEKCMSDPDFSIEKMSREVGLSATHLNKKISAITGKTTSEYVRSIRLKRACQLLVKTQLSISEIAYEIGYNIPKYFSKHFKEEFGMLPTEYRKNIK